MYDFNTKVMVIGYCVVALRNYSDQFIMYTYSNRIYVSDKGVF